MSRQKDSLERFIDAQLNNYATALAEIKSEKKQSHWMWYVFPQIKGLGLSETSQYYAIKNSEEADNYLRHPILGNRLIEISNELLKLKTNDAYTIFGSPDELKLKSCMTLFSKLKDTNPVFDLILQKFYQHQYDTETLEILKNQAPK